MKCDGFIHYHAVNGCHPMNSLQFVPVTHEEGFKKVSLLAQQIWREHYPPIVGSPQVEYMLAHMQSAAAIGRQVRAEGFRYFTVSEMNGGPIGYIAVVDKPDSLYLSKFYLKKEHRGKGLTGAMMDFVEEQAREKGYDRIALVTHKRNFMAHKAYGKLGFAVEAPVVTDIGGGFVMDDFRFVKRL